MLAFPGSLSSVYISAALLWRQEQGQLGFPACGGRSEGERQTGSDRLPATDGGVAPASAGVRATMLPNRTVVNVEAAGNG